jgi:hypothetical protein
MANFPVHYKFNPLMPVYQFNGSTFVESWSAMFKNSTKALSVYMATAVGNKVDPNSWTGSDIYGNTYAGLTCNDWTVGDSTAGGSFGSNLYLGAAWKYKNPALCSEKFQVNCLCIHS